MDFGVVANKNPNICANAEEYGPYDYRKISIEEKEVAQLVRVPAWGMQVLKVLGLNPAAVYWLLGLCATGVLRPACNWEQLGAVIAASPLRRPLSRRSSSRTERDKTKWF